MSLSVIIPSFNRADVLPRALDSVIAQSVSKHLDQYEVIVVDDGSSDDTAALVGEHYPQVKLIKQANKGVSAARNAGIRASQGEWLAFLDSDDQWFNEKLATQLDALTNRQCLISHTDEVWIRNGVRVNQMKKHAKPDGWVFEACLPLCAISPSSVVIHRSVFDEVGVFDETLPACEDYDMWLRISARYEVALINQPMIYKYGGHTDQLSRQFWGMDRFRVVALEKALQGELSNEQFRAAKQILLTKLTILRKGAIKHANQYLAQQCLERLNYWNQYDEEKH